MKRNQLYVALIVSVLLTGNIALYATGQGEHRPMAATRTITDGLGRAVEIPVEPERMVTAGRAMLMTINALWAFPGAPDRIVGVGDIQQGRGVFLADMDPTWERLTILDRSAGAEQIASLNPDVVVLKSVVRESIGEPLERLGIPVVYVELESPEQYQRDLQVLGDLVNDVTRGEELARMYRHMQEEVTAAASPGAPTPRTLMIYYRVSGGDVSFNVPPAGWMQTDMVRLAGGEPVWLDANPGRGWATISFEQIAAWDPEVILFVEYGGRGTEIRDQLIQEPRWQELQAVQNNRFLVMPTDYYSWDQPDVRWILGLTWSAWAIGRQDINMEAKTREFYRILYGMDSSTFDRMVAPVLSGDLP
jgi:iron complex transport system substrate-binding protein